MPQGFDGVRAAAASRAGGGGGGTTWFKLPNDRDEARVRFLEENDAVCWAWCHEMPPAPGKNWGESVPCRDQELSGDPDKRCPGCESENEKVRYRTFVGWINLIWRDAPKIKSDADGNWQKDASGNLIFEGTEDQVALWEQGVKTFTVLDEKNAHYKGLSSRDFIVKRKGTGLKTEYSVEPADPDGGPQPMSQADVDLAENGKYDVKARITPPSIENWGKAPSNDDSGSAPTDVMSQAGDVAPFQREAVEDPDANIFTKA